MDLRFYNNSKKYEAQAKWRGFADEQPEWEPVDTISKDVSYMMKLFLDELNGKRMVIRVRRSLWRQEKRVM